MSLFIQIIILIAVLAAMVMVLLAIRQLSNYEGFDDSNETSHLKKEIEDDGRVVSQNNIFHSLIDSEKDKESKSTYKDISKEPISRKE